VSALRLPRRLAAPEPGWTIEADVVVVGSGIAGLTTALQIAQRSTLRIVLVTKDVLAAGSTPWAQGGIAAALGEGDSPEDHFADTVVAGAGVCDEAAVRVLVREGPAAVRELAQIGARFDRAQDGRLALTREGGHHRDRIVHAGGDATGAEVERALVTRVLDAADIEVIEHALLLDLLRAPAGGTRSSGGAESSGSIRDGAPADGDGPIAGITLHVMGEGQRDGVGAVRARAVVLATGGIGQVYASSTNPPVSTGDGVAAALRAGAVVRDLEFVQFHPTVTWLGAGSRGQQPLVSEAVRGEGAFLVDSADDAVATRFMAGVHELADLAPRDVVAQAIVRRMREAGAEHVWLDARAFGAERWRVRFPTIHAALLAHGIDPVRELIPVVPACHFASGGVRTDLAGATSIPGLYAVGETACTGVHGANRLASNSLLEGLVFGHRIAEAVVRRLGEPAPPPAVAAAPRAAGLLDDAARPLLQALMSEHAGVLREAKGLAAVEAGLTELSAETAGTDGRAGRAAPAATGVGAGVEPATENWEATNLLTVAAALVTAARCREETRGSHWREDFPDRDDQRWRTHLDLTLTPAGSPLCTFGRPDSAQIRALKGGKR
jgi:L-aspartate oxidase